MPHLVRDEFKTVITAVLAMILLGVLVAVLVAPTNGWAVLILPVTLFVPRLALERIARSSSVTRLERPQAMQVYVAAIADVLELPRHDREQLACAADLIEPIHGNTSGIKSFDWATATYPAPRCSRCTPVSAGPGPDGRRDSPPTRSRTAVASSRSPRLGQI